MKPLSLKCYLIMLMRSHDSWIFRETFFSLQFAFSSYRNTVYNVTKVFFSAKDQYRFQFRYPKLPIAFFSSDIFKTTIFSSFRPNFNWLIFDIVEGTPINNPFSIENFYTLWETMSSADWKRRKRKVHSNLRISN